MYWVYGKDSCSYCKRAVDLLKAHGQSVAYIDVENGPRYKALGNSMAVPVMRWIGRRIQIVEDFHG